MRRLMLTFALGLSIATAGLSGVPVTEAGGGGSCHEPQTQAAVDQVDIIGSCFSPTLVYVQPGTAVQWVNRDAIPHNIVGTGYAWGEGQPMDQNRTAAFSFDSPGIYPYFCSLHLAMAGVVVVGDPDGVPASQAAAVTKAPAQPTWLPTAQTQAIAAPPGQAPAIMPAVSTAKDRGGDGLLSSGALGSAGFFAGVVAAGGAGMLRRAMRRE